MNLENKYWKYKERLNKFFIAIDDYNNQGANLPASSRHIWGKDSKIISWGDTIINMSYYLMYLATEYKILKEKNDIRYKNSINHFYLGLQSLKRLDTAAEREYRKKYNIKSSNKDDLNGFMIRDDIDRDFLNRYPYLKNNDFYGSVEYVYSGLEPFGYISLSDLDNLSKEDKEKQKNPTEISQDQMWHLFLGLALCKKIFIKNTHEDILIGNRIETANIPELIDNIVDRFINLLLKNKCRIINPVTGKYVLRGSNAKLFMYGFIKAAEKITGKKYKEYKFRFFKRIMFKSIIRIAEFAYNNIIPIYNHFQKNKDKKVVIKNYSYRCLGIVSDIWFTKDIAKYMSNYYLKKDWFPHFPLIYKLIHNKGTITIPKEKIEYILATAPENGPYNLKIDGKNQFEDYNWSSSSLLDCPETRGNDQIDFNAVYNGVDYLLLYNLYKLTLL